MTATYINLRNGVFTCCILTGVYFEKLLKETTVYSGDNSIDLLLMLNVKNIEFNNNSNEVLMLMLNVKMIEFNNNSNEVLMQESKYIEDSY